MIIGAPLEWTPHGDRAEENRLNMAAVVARFEPWLRAHPEHYLQFLLMRWRVRGTDVRPLFADYPPAPDQLTEAQAQARLARAGEWKER